MTGVQTCALPISIRTVVDKPIKFVGTGEKMDALDIVHPERMAERILGMGDCGDHIDEVILKDIRGGSADIVRLTPVNMVCHYTYEVNGLRGLDTVADLRAALSGMSGSLNKMCIRDSSCTG